MRWLEGIIDSMDMSLSKLQEMLEGQVSLVCCSPWRLKESDMTEQLSAWVFPVIMYGCESWTIKKAEH